MTRKAPGSIRPSRLQPGMTIGIIAPSSPIRDHEREAAGLKCVKDAGYEYVIADHVFDGHGYLAGMDKDRAADFTAMFARKDVDAVLCARGGYGAIRMVDLIDWEVVAANPKPFVGFSDITTLHLAFENRIGMVTHYGPMLMSLGKGIDESASSCFWGLLENGEPLGVLPSTGSETVTLVGGKATGRLAGGCITLLCTASGTTDAPDFTGRIVVLEDIGDAVYRVDRCIVQLIRACHLDKAAGIVVGTVTDWEKEENTAWMYGGIGC
jgi:muramoyltetrapeptide carboxypeptidase